MNIIYTGKQNDFPPQYREKLEGKLQKISKMIERKGEKEAHIIHKQERFLHVIEITINMFDHRIVCCGEDAELLPAVNIALEKLDKQVVKLREKWRDTKRHAAPPELEAAIEPSDTSEKSAKRPKDRIYRVDHRGNGQKPMTLDEAIMEMDGTRNGQPDYLVFHDADTDRLSVLLRRRDGNFDLIET
ncbi:MAG: ribosome-associated translation inhibitor RaiA [Acidobacteria bacterium]|nr:MAG: ribosome-associated translation inhibitor RaiA [Acidobacteriota bacterium]